MFRKTLLTGLSILIGIACSGTAYAYMFNDPVDIAWPTAGYDRIGDATFELFGINITENSSNTVLDIYTNYPEAGYQVGSWYTKPADLALDFNEDGIFEYGIAFTAHDSLSAGTLYSVSDWYLSNDFAPSKDYIYFKDKFVQIKTGTTLSAFSISWIDNDPGADAGIPDWKIQLIFDGSSMPQDPNNIVNFFYGTATCSNDFIEATYNHGTPEPASMLLLGGGLLGLAGFKFKRKE